LKSAIRNPIALLYIKITHKRFLYQGFAFLLMKVGTHKFIINKSIDKLDIELFKRNRNYLLKGARKADYSLSHLCLGSLNHFYNPTKKRGWLFLRNAKQQGRKFFEKAVDNYNKGEISKSMVQLGIALHLIADSATPVHTKNKFHIPRLLLIPIVEDKLERFINKNLLIAEMSLENIKATLKNSVDEYFEELSRTAYEYRQKRVGLLAFLSVLFGRMPREELVCQTKKLVPLSVSCTMGAMQIFYNRINSKN
jgi:hypothetical protein